MQAWRSSWHYAATATAVSGTEADGLRDTVCNGRYNARASAPAKPGTLPTACCCCHHGRGGREGSTEMDNRFVMSDHPGKKKLYSVSLCTDMSSMILTQSVFLVVSVLT